MADQRVSARRSRIWTNRPERSLPIVVGEVEFGEGGAELLVEPLVGDIAQAEKSIVAEHQSAGKVKHVGQDAKPEQVRMDERHGRIVTCCLSAV